jgi:Aldos-2-ulose dehydratase, beta-propeller domain/FG-GAP-like repeat
MLDWKIHQVAEIPDGYQLAVADVNGDGWLDILGLSSVHSIVNWYEAPDWKPHSITTKTRKNISLAPLPQADGPVRGVALASGFDLNDSTHGGDLWWALPPRAGEPEWALEAIDKIPTSHRLRWANLFGDSRRQLVDAPLLGYGAKAPDYAGGAPLSWFEMPDAAHHGVPGRPVKPHPWKRNVIDQTLSVVHGLLVFDWDGDGRDEILTASFEGVSLFRAVNAESKPAGDALVWTKTHLAPGNQSSHPARGSSEIGVGEVHGQRFLATIEPWHGDEVVVYLGDGLGKARQRLVIDHSFHDGHALAVADLDGDGNSEIIAGYRGPGTSLHVYYAQDSSGHEWKRQTLDTQMSAAGVAVGDINRDGRPDIVAIGASTGNLRWYQNLG